jgi:hypothetical protein
MTCVESTINALVRVTGPPNWAYYSPQACLLLGGGAICVRRPGHGCDGHDCPHARHHRLVELRPITLCPKQSAKVL